jgi:hypothetical protein
MPARQSSQQSGFHQFSLLEFTSSSVRLWGENEMDLILNSGILVFLLLVIGLGLTYKEFNKLD